MINVTQIISQADQTVTWKLTATPPEHDINGIMCHAVDEGVHDSMWRRVMGMLGYDLIDAKVNFQHDAWPDRVVTYFYAKAEEQ